MHRHKFYAKAVESDGIKFPSMREARYYSDLKFQQKGGIVLFFLRQVPFDLPGGVKYKVDFQVFYTDGNVEFIEVKGFKTKDYIMKKKMVESLYPVKIEER